MLPIQQAQCTNGPSFPNERPAATVNIIPIRRKLCQMSDSKNNEDIPNVLMVSVHLPRYPLIMKPESIVLISGIPEPQAYGAKVRTNEAANKAKKNDHTM